MRGGLLEMGLDTVEVVMIVEETFDFTIPDRDAEKLRTVGEMYRYVLEHIPVDNSSKCLSSVAFYRLRRVLMDAFKTPRSNIRPTSRVEDILPRGSRKSDWQRLASKLKLTLPTLRLPSGMQNRLHWVQLLMSSIVVSAFFVMVSSQIGNLMVVCGTVGLIACEIALLNAMYRWTEPYALEFAPNCRTLRGIVEILVEHDRERTVHEEKRWNEVQVWETLRAILVGQMGYDPQAVTEDARFVEDLGAG
jgi:acyl carrier protein